MMKKVLLMMTALLAATPALAVDVLVTWVHPTQYNTGAALPITDIQHTTVQYGTCTTATTPTFGTLTAEQTVLAPAAEVKILGIPTGTYCFRAATTDVRGVQGPWSTVVSKNVIVLKAKAPTAVTVTIQ